MTRRVRSVSGQADVTLEDGWQVAPAPAGAFEDPRALEGLAWTPARVPATAASALRAAGKWSLDGPPRSFDAEDWWWRVRFPGSPGEKVRLAFDGIATIADVWLDGAPLFTSPSMFASHVAEVELRAENELVLRCRSLDAALAAKRPRPRWRTPMIAHQQLRWHRTTLLGRTPGWSPPAAPVGPWRPVRIVRRGAVSVEEVELRTRVDGGRGVLDVRARIGGGEKAEIVVARGGREHRAVLGGDGQGALVVPDVALWWPHTHGEPALYEARLEIDGRVRAELGPVGFRTIGVDRTGDGFSVHVNGARVFCRGACWTPVDVASLASDRAGAAVAQAAACGMNMLRVGGTMVYEDDAFHDAADAAGMLVWQDLMFANMDYPEDEGFVALVTEEVRRELGRLGGRPSTAVVCGNSEGEQQASMWGASRDRLRPKLFHDTLAEVARACLPDVPYWPSSAHGGDFPHCADRGTTSYYGVGAYLRPLEDARRAEVRFATECLAFANVPEGATTRVHDPRWKERVPRDLGAGWDFDDVRDHYLALLFRVDPLALRYADHERYLALSRVVTGEVMAQVFGEWRRARSTCGGGLVWFLRDLWQGAGWGVVAADGLPKAAFHYLRRALAPVALHVSDEGGNGLVVHAVNDAAAPVDAALTIAAYRGEACVLQGEKRVTVAPRSAIEVPATSLFDGFLDLGHAYRFGPPTCDLVVARLEAAEAFFFPLGLPSQRAPDIGLAATAARVGEHVELTVTTRAFAQSVVVEGAEAYDAYFHLAPGGTRKVRLGAGARQVTVTALNAEPVLTVALP